MDVLRRLTGLLLVLSLAASLPVAAARAGCVCDHAHGSAATEPHTCTAACTAATCPMHRGESRPADAHRGADDDAIGCSCARDALVLIGHAAPPAIVPDGTTVPLPLLARARTRALVASPLGLAPAPPAPPPRA